MKRAKIKEWTAALQLVCPYCNAIQTNTTALHVVHSPPSTWICEKCKKKMKVWTMLDIIFEKLKTR